MAARSIEEGAAQRRSAHRQQFWPHDFSVHSYSLRPLADDSTATALRNNRCFLRTAEAAAAEG